MTDSAGQRLLAARKTQGLSVEDITRQIKMRPAIIAALEADNYGYFSSITHARSFLLLYGNFLKVDVKDGLTDLTSPAKIGVEKYQYLNVERDADQSFRTRPMFRRMSHSPGPRGDQLPKTLGIIALVLAFLFVGSYLAINLKRLNLSSPTNTKEAVAPLPEGSTPPVSVPQTSPVITKYPKSKPEATPDSSPFYAPTSDDHRGLLRHSIPPVP